MKTYDFAYGRGRKEFSIDESLVIKEVRTEEFTPMSDVKQGVLDAIYNLCAFLNQPFFDELIQRIEHGLLAFRSKPFLHVADASRKFSFAILRKSVDYCI